MKYIELNRSFHTLTTREGGNTVIEIRRLLYYEKKHHWPDLLGKYRLIILSEAGAGKTVEIEHIANKLRREGKWAFFLRLEYVANDFECSFEVGTYEEFEQWLRSGEEAWLLLDSVDEARLKDPKDFERAIRVLSRGLRTAIDRVHVVITGRTTAWRPETDLTLCKKHFPYSAQQEINPNSADELDSGSAIENRQVETNEQGNGEEGFVIVTLDDLSSEQVESYIRERGVTGSAAFLDAVERADAWYFTARPQDLKELVDFWKDKGEIGGRLEIMQNSIERRLIERDQDRAEVHPFSMEKARQGAKLLAAATTLTGQQAIRVPDGAENSKGLPVQGVLSDWDARDQATLLSRPIFDEEIYGTVRFHHRSVREYLTAEWFLELLKQETSRRAIEALFFRNQYGVDIVAPTLRPVLPWLILDDEKIRERVAAIKPEIFFEGGDPVRLPPEVRRQILSEVCERIVAGPTEGTVGSFEAVQRFASADLVPDIRQLMQKYKGHKELTSFLLRMVWLGRLEELLPEAMEIALNPSAEKYVRMAAFRGVMAVGLAADQSRVRQTFLDESSVLNRYLLSVLVGELEPVGGNLPWLLASLEKSEPEEPYTVDYLTEKVKMFVEHSELAVLPSLVAGLTRLLAFPPYVEQRFCEVSEKFQWLMVPACKAVERLILARHEASWDVGTLEVLRNLGVIQEYKSNILTDIKADFSKLVSEWSELNRALFWHEVQKAREVEERRGGSPLTSFWQLPYYYSLWSFQDDDFGYLVQETAQRECLDDRLVALLLAFQLYKKAQRPEQRLEQLKAAVTGSAELSARLKELVNPPDGRERQMQRSQSRWERRQATRQRIEKKRLMEWELHLRNNLGQITVDQSEKPGEITNALYYLFRQVQKEKSSSSHWSGKNWKSLISQYGENVACFYRDSTIALWRHFNPTLRSEGAPFNQTAYGVILGLAGLANEAEEVSSWIENLSTEEVTLACRYATFELNGFPAWLPHLFEHYPGEVCDLILQEIRYELSLDDPENTTHYIISDVSYSGQWLWDLLADDIRHILEEEIENLTNVDHLLKILEGSNIDTSVIRELASRKCRTLEESAYAARWYAVWTGVDPEAAIVALKERIEEIEEKAEQTNFAMIFITNLLGTRFSGGTFGRDLFKTPGHLKSLYLLMAEHIHFEDDIRRSNQGAYTPGLRDDAQDARRKLFNLLKDIPGKEAFLALLEIAKEHPEESYRPWVLNYADAKAEEEGDIDSWKLEQVRDFHREMERSPQNHRELAELALHRLYDLKDDLEHGDSSIAGILKKVPLETDIRKYISKELRDKAYGRYTIVPEEELADGKKIDLRFHGNGFDGPVPVELKLADKWTGPSLFERLINQLCGDYLRDRRSSRGIFLLVHRGKGKSNWELSESGKRVDFSRLVVALQECWAQISSQFPNIDEITVVGIDLTLRKSWVQQRFLQLSQFWAKRKRG
jgi:hypothetical protein